MRNQISRATAALCHCGARRYSTAPSIANTLLNRPAKCIPDTLSPTPSHLLNITLSDLIPGLQPSESPHTKVLPLPQGHHLVYFPIQTPPSQLAPDGADLDHWPGPPYHRRMWAAGEVKFSDDWAQKMMVDGREVKCVEKIEDVKVKGEGEKEKVFVDVWRRYGQDGDAEGSWPIEERRTLVFMRNHESASVPPEPAPQRTIKYPHKPTASYKLKPSPLHLFHFSALSFNAHAIHLNPLYARTVDGHRNLLVHGPLSLALMLRVLSAHISKTATIKSIVYRNYAPLYVEEEMRICVRKLEGEGRWDVWVEGPNGGLAIKGSAVIGEKA